MNSAEIRQSFLEFFKERGHTVVPSASLMPDAPNLLFTNAGMNQFVPYFLGERTAPFPRAADTQKCIRAGGKHNDLEDVGLDAYHQTFFEMLGNWSFGDYFKKEAIHWAWELITQVWKFPKNRLYATVYQPGAGDPSEFDQEAYDIWKGIFLDEGLDPAVHIVNGDKKDNFWMMGDTGPCGPCSEIHVDLAPEGDTRGSLVNADSPWCIEIWNLVFIQLNAKEDGTFEPLPAKHVDTGMGFERVVGILSTTKQFTEFNSPPSNYESDLFQDIFKAISELCPHTYRSTLPENGQSMSEQESRDCAFRVIADHIRTLSFSIADGILPGNEGRNYVLRRILRRAVLYGKKLDLPQGFFAQLVDPLVEKMSAAFPELNTQHTVIKKVITSEETAFDKTIDRGLALLEKVFAESETTKQITGEKAFELYDTYGFPLDLTGLIGRERGYSVDHDGFEAAMERQRRMARAAQVKSAIKVQSSEGDAFKTDFIGYSSLSGAAKTLASVPYGAEKTAIITDRSPFYAEMGGQIGDSGSLIVEGKTYRITDTQKDDQGQILHLLDGQHAIDDGSEVVLSVDADRRQRIERHHSAAHIVNWGLREVLGSHVRQAGSLVADDRMRFDFSHYEALSNDELDSIERLINARILENGLVQTDEIAIEDKPDDVVAVFGEKYGNRVRVVDIGGFSKELCGGTHVSAAGEIGPIKLLGDSGIAAGTRRIEAVAGESALAWISSGFRTLDQTAKILSCPIHDVAVRIEALLEERKQLEKKIKAFEQKNAAAAADDLAATAQESSGIQVVKQQAQVSSPKDLKSLGAQVLEKLDKGCVVLGASIGGKASVAAFCSKEAIAADLKAGDIIRRLTTELGGKGGGKPEFAMGGGQDRGDLAQIIENFDLQG